MVLIDHHQFEKDDETWARFERDTNVHRSAPARTRARTRPLEPFETRAPRTRPLEPFQTRAPLSCVQQARVRNARGPRAPDRARAGGRRWRAIKDLIELGDYPSPLPTVDPTRVPTVR